MRMSLNEEDKPRLVSPVLLEAIAEKSPSSLERRDPVVAAQALEMLAQGCQWEAIRDATQLTFNEISRLRARNRTPIDQRRAELAQDGFEMAEGLRLLIKQKMERLANNEDALDKTNLRDLVLPYGIAVDKGMQAMGENKVVIEHTSRKPSLEDAMRAIKEARENLKQVKPEDTEGAVEV